MKSLFLIGIVVSGLILAACGAQPTPAPTPTLFESPLAPNMPNPASKFCEDQGYTLEIRTSADGSQTGYCIFPDGSECEEWAFFRGECAPPPPP